MRFVYNHRTQGRGGEGVHISSIVRALRKRGHSVDMVSPPGVDPMGSAGDAPVDKSDRPVKGIQRLWKAVSRHSPQVVFEMLELGYNVFAWRRLRRLLRKGEAVVFYERYAFFLVAGVWLARRRGIPAILEVNEVAGIERARGLVMVRLARFVETYVFGHADAVIVVSSFLAAEAVRRGASPERVHLMPNAIDPSIFEMNNARDLRHELKLQDCVVVGFVGWFDHWDRLDLLVESIGRLIGKNPTLRLLLVGDGPVADELRSTVARLGLNDIVLMPGPVPRVDVPVYLATMQIGVLPSSNEFGSPIALFEMMASGLAVIAPDVAPVRDVVDDGVNGFVVPAGDTDAMERSIARLATDSRLRETMGAAARNRVLERHTWDANGGEVATIAANITTGN